MDPLDDIFGDEPTVKNARPVGRFQPKAKPRPPKKGPKAAPVSSSQAVETVNSAGSELRVPVANAKPPSENCSDVLPNADGGGRSSVEKPVGENAGVSVGLEALGDFPPHTTATDTECTIPPSEAVTADVPMPESGGEGLGIPVISSVEDSTQTCEVADEPLAVDKPIGSSNDGHDQMPDREWGREELDATASLNITELTAKPGQRTGKFQPKRKIQLHKETVSCSLGSQSVPDEINYAEKDSSPMFQQDDVLDLSSLGFTHTLPNEETGLPLNEEPINLMETSQLDSGNLVTEESLPEVPVKLVSRRAKTGRSKTSTAKDPSPEQKKASTSNQENETGRALRLRKKGKVSLCQLVDEDDDENEVLANGDTEEVVNNEEELQVGNEPQKEKVKRKSGKKDDGKEKPTRKRKKGKETSDQEASVKPKKFSHSSRRRQRRVDKTLLETPEDEIDYQKVPLRDLILLFEHNEREVKKEEKAARAQGVKQSNGNSSGIYNDEGVSTSKQGGEYDEEEETPMDIDTTAYFNYQSHMKRTAAKRWSKQDTEQFYEALRQFGTDFTMMGAMMFPELLPSQLKSKYKKEARHHAERLNEALANPRAKDISHFETAIERVKQEAAQKNQNADEDDLMDLTDNEVADEETLNVDDDEEQEEHIEVKESDDAANDDTIDVPSPLKEDDDDEEDEELRWSQYKSAT